MGVFMKLLGIALIIASLFLFSTYMVIAILICAVGLILVVVGDRKHTYGSK